MSRNLALAVLCIGAAVAVLRVVMFSMHRLRSRRPTAAKAVKAFGRGGA